MRFPLSPAVFPADVLPAGNVSFNSMSIEAYLYNIPGLAERFVYFNNDMMVNAPVEPSTFFAPHPISGIMGPRLAATGVGWRRDPINPRLAFTPTTSDLGLDGYNTGLLNMHYLLDAQFGYEPRPLILHQGVPSTISAYKRAWQLFPEALRRTGVTLFRAEDNVIVHHLALWTAIYEHKAVRLDPSNDPSSYFLAYADALHHTRTQTTHTHTQLTLRAYSALSWVAARACSCVSSTSPFFRSSDRSFGSTAKSNPPIFKLGLYAAPYQLLCINDGTNGFGNMSNASINVIVDQVHDFFEAINNQQIERYGYGPHVLPSNHSEAEGVALDANPLWHSTLICDGGICEHHKFPPSAPSVSQ